MTIMESPRKLRIVEDTDVLVIGGGTAGTIAAISAAKCGVHVVVVERFGSLGGTASNGLVTPTMDPCLPEVTIQSAISKQLDQRMERTGHGIIEGGACWFDPEYLKIILEEMVLKEGVSLRYYTIFSDVIQEHGQIKGVIVEDKSGRHVITAKCVIDCSGDADVCAKAGVPFRSGDPMTGHNQAMSVRYMMANVDTDVLAAYLRTLGKKMTDRPPILGTALMWGRGWPLEPVFQKAVESGDLCYEDGIYWQAMTVPGCPRALAFNCPGIYINNNGTSPQDLTEAQIYARRVITRQAEFYKKYLPGFQNAYVSSIAPMVGVRESRRIQGIYTLHNQDVLSCRKFEDAVARCNYPVDVHTYEQNDEDFIFTCRDGLRYYEVPFRCLVPVQTEGLLVAGRCISADFLAQGSLRIQPIVRTLGEAAGYAAAISVQTGTPISKISGHSVRSEMDRRIRDEGVSL